ncbi:MAG: DUF4384 domain-containing protein [Deltaproteobacteria bacterium]|nr:DUF4384 domain-containing protein [Deltaproteobacteria bacterium]
MSARPTQPWRCLRGHDNEPDVRRCEVCRLPRWVTWYTIAAAGTVILIVLGYGGYSLSQFLKQRQYTSLVRKVWNDDQKITADERKALDDLRDYLRVSAVQATQWEREATGATVLAEQGSDLQPVRTDLEQGRLRQARQTVETLHREQPQRTDVRQLQDEIEQKVRGRIAAVLQGGASGSRNMDAPAVLINLNGEEQSFRLSVEPLEPVYFYLFRIDRSKKIDVLFPRANGNPANPLSPGQTMWLPSPAPEPGYPFHEVTGEVAEIWMVMSRWPARELEQWGTKLTGQEGEDAGRHLVEALKERKEAQVGGCDVRTLQFVGGSSG